jgi:anti-sigma factor RsiW
MSERSGTGADDHRRAWEAIPWLVNGTANAEQRQMLRAHLTQCADCRGELTHQRELHEAISAAPAPGDDDAEAGLARLLARIDHAQAEAAAARPAMRPREAPRRLTLWLAAAVVAEAVALSVVGIGFAVRERATQYAVLGEPTAPTRAEATIRIVPAASLRLDDLQRLLHSLDLQIVAGPSSAGAYDLAPRSGQPALERQLAALRADPGLRLVEPIDATALERR